jgi:hypothetical protein
MANDQSGAMNGHAAENAARRLEPPHQCGQKSSQVTPRVDDEQTREHGKHRRDVRDQTRAPE